MKKTLNYGFTLLVIVASIAGLLATRGWTPATALFPRAIGIPTLLLAVVILLRDVLANRRQATQAEGDDSAESAELFRAVALRFAWLIGFVAVIWALGLVAAIFLFVLGYLALQGKYHWRKSLILATATSATVYLIFNVAFKVVWPGGALLALWM